jgi:hypothetical protein
MSATIVVIIIAVPAHLSESQFGECLAESSPFCSAMLTYSDSGPARNSPISRAPSLERLGVAGKAYGAKVGNVEQGGLVAGIPAPPYDHHEGSWACFSLPPLRVDASKDSEIL